MQHRDYLLERARASESSLLLARVCFLTIGSVICTALGAAVTWVHPGPLLFFAALIGVFVMLFVCRAVAYRFPVNLLALAAFAALEGMVMGPALLVYARINNGPMVIVQAALLAAILFGVVGTLGYTSSRSYAHWLPWLAGALILMLIGGMVLWFVSAPTVHWVYALLGAALFIAFTFVDFTRIRHNFGAEDYIAATMQVYLDLINLFWALLRLLSRRD